MKTSSPMGIIECKSKSVLEWLLTFVTLGFFIKLMWGKSWALRHMICVCLGPPDWCWPVARTRWGTIFHEGSQHTLDTWILTCLMLLRAGGLVACSHMKSPSDKNTQNLAAIPHNNNVCNGSRSNKRHNTPEILPISFPSTIEWNILAQAITLKACSILLDAGRSIPNVPLQPGPGQGLLCHYAPTTSVKKGNLMD